MRRLGWVVMVVAACTDGGGRGADSDTACDLDASTSGAVTWSSEAQPACVIPFGPTAGILMVYAPIGEGVARFEVDVKQIMEGQTGEFPASVAVQQKDGPMFKTPVTCVVIVSEHADTGVADSFSRTFQTVGTGSCEAEATQQGGSETIAIAPFSFRFPAHW